MDKSTKKYAEFGNRLNELMDARNIRAQEIADRLEMALSSVNFWRAGDMMPRLETAEVLAQMLEVSPGYLMFGADGGPASSNKPVSGKKREGATALHSPPADRPVLGAVQGALDGLVAAGVSEMELMPVLEMLVRLKEGRGSGKR